MMLFVMVLVLLFLFVLFWLSYRQLSKTLWFLTGYIVIAFIAVGIYIVVDHPSASDATVKKQAILQQGEVLRQSLSTGHIADIPEALKKDVWTFTYKQKTLNFYNMMMNHNHASMSQDPFVTYVEHTNSDDQQVTISFYRTPLVVNGQLISEPPELNIHIMNHSLIVQTDPSEDTRITYKSFRQPDVVRQFMKHGLRTPSAHLIDSFGGVRYLYIQLPQHTELISSDGYRLHTVDHSS